MPKRPHLTYANVVATLALFVAIGGSSYAAVQLTGASVKDGSLTGRDVKNSSLTGRDVRNRSLLARDFRKGQLPAGRVGPAGPRGEDGPAGPDGPAGEPGSGNGYTKEESDTRYLAKPDTAADSELLDGMDSGAFAPAGLFGSPPAPTPAIGGPGFDDCKIGEVRLFAGSRPPTQTVFAEGQLLPVGTNLTLFGVLGIQYGGNGQTTFGLPDLRSASPKGDSPHGVRYVICVGGAYA
jgi:hypothetical protein